jgi:hypothetical protein
MARGVRIVGLVLLVRVLYLVTPENFSASRFNDEIFLCCC